MAGKSIGTIDVDISAPPEVMPFLAASGEIERTKARMWALLHIVLLLIVAASIVPLIVLSAKAVSWIAGL